MSDQSSVYKTFNGGNYAIEDEKQGEEKENVFHYKNINR